MQGMGGWDFRSCLFNDFETEDVNETSRSRLTLLTSIRPKDAAAPARSASRRKKNMRYSQLHKYDWAIAALTPICNLWPEPLKVTRSQTGWEQRGGRIARRQQPCRLGRCLSRRAGVRDTQPSFTWRTRPRSNGSHPGTPAPRECSPIITIL